MDFQQGFQLSSSSSSSVIISYHHQLLVISYQLSSSSSSSSSSVIISYHHQLSVISYQYYHHHHHHHHHLPALMPRKLSAVGDISDWIGCELPTSPNPSHLTFACRQISRTWKQYLKHLESSINLLREIRPDRLDPYIDPRPNQNSRPNQIADLTRGHHHRRMFAMWSASLALAAFAAFGTVGRIGAATNGTGQCFQDGIPETLPLGREKPGCNSQQGRYGRVQIRKRY